jgi:hypothetical protein
MPSRSRSRSQRSRSKARGKTPGCQPPLSGGAAPGTVPKGRFTRSDRSEGATLHRAGGPNGHELIPGYRTFAPSPPQWSVAGLIGFSVGVPGKNVPGGEQFDLFITTPAGVGPRALTRTRFVDEQFEDWSSDGRVMTITAMTRRASVRFGSQAATCRSSEPPCGTRPVEWERRLLTGRREARFHHGQPAGRTELGRHEH